MHLSHRFPLGIAAFAVIVLTAPSRAGAQQSTPPAATGTAVLPPSHDGSHDFDWIFGTWKATLRRLVKPLTGSTTWVDFEGRQLSKPIWGGKANLDEFTVDSATRHLSKPFVPAPDVTKIVIKVRGRVPPGRRPLPLWNRDIPFDYRQLNLLLANIRVVPDGEAPRRYP